MENKVKMVYTAIVKVTESLAKHGISKDRKNEQQGYKFRGIDDVYNALAPFLAEAKLCILPCVLERSVVERLTKSGGNMFYVTVKVDHAFISAEDGSEHHVVTYGEAMDTGDKATNKAMSAAYKYAAIESFCIPTEGDNDTESKTHEAIDEYITQKDVSYIRDTLAYLEKSEDKILSFAGVESLEKITKSGLGKVKMALDASVDKKKKAEKNADNKLPAK